MFVLKQIGVSSYTQRTYPLCYGINSKPTTYSKIFQQNICKSVLNTVLCGLFHSRLLAACRELGSECLHLFNCILILALCIAVGRAHLSNKSPNKVTDYQVNVTLLTPLTKTFVLIYDSVWIFTASGRLQLSHKKNSYVLLIRK